MRKIIYTIFILTIITSFISIAGHPAFAHKTNFDHEHDDDEDDDADKAEIAKTQKMINELVAKEEQNRIQAAAAGVTVSEWKSMQGSASSRPSFYNSPSQRPASTGTAGTPPSSTEMNEISPPEQIKQPSSNMIYIKPTLKTPSKLWNEVR